MTTQESSSEQKWSEDTSRSFLDFGKYYIPEREAQIQMICDLIPPHPGDFTVMDLGCGEGLLAQALLKQYPKSTVIGLDGSETMILKAKLNLKEFRERFMVKHFDLEKKDWRTLGVRVQAVVSSLTIHHLSAEQKQDLFLDVYQLISPGGALVIADVIQPAGTTSRRLAAKGWDKAVKQRAIELDGNEEAFLQFSSDEWNMFRFPDEMDKPSTLLEQLKWLEEAGFAQVDVYWMKAGHAIFGGIKP